jgi:hypothetical protein
MDSILGFSHLREEGSLDYDGGFFRLQIHTKFDTNIHRQHTPFVLFIGLQGGKEQWFPSQAHFPSDQQ